MPIFRRLLARGLSGVKVVFDPWYGDPGIRQIAEKLSAGEWELAERMLAARNDLWLVEDILSSDECPVPLAAFESWASASSSGQSLTLLGRAQTRAAWEIRGRAYADQVDSEAWDGFFSGLQTAEATLMAAVDATPAASGPWVGLMTTARGLQLGRDELRERFDNAHAREPFRPDACSTMLQGLCQKWGGTHDEMFAFARWIEADAEPDSASRDLIHLAHFEFVIAERDQGLLPSTYFRDPSVSAELVASAQSFLTASPRTARPSDLRPLNMMVFTLDPIDKKSAAVLLEVVERIGDRPTETPWSYFGDGIARRFAAVRDERLAVARRFR